MDIVWNPKNIPADEDVVVLTAHQHSKHTTKILGCFVEVRQNVSHSAAILSDFDLPFRDAYEKAQAYVRAHGFSRLYIHDPYGVGVLEV
jgi:hypothetical protein